MLIVCSQTTRNRSTLTAFNCKTENKNAILEYAIETQSQISFEFVIIHNSIPISLVNFYPVTINRPKNEFGG